MKTLIHFKEFCDEMTLSASRKHKQEVLTKYKDDEVVKKYLKINFDPYTVFGISTKKLTRRVRPEFWYQAPTVFELFDYLTIHNTGTDVDVAVCREMLFVASEVDPALESLLMELICKDLSIGVDTKTISKIMPGVVRTFEVMLAQKYFDNPAKVSGQEFAITTKLDGFRLIAFKEAGKVNFYSRVGQPIEGLIEIEAEILKSLPDNFALDGELTISNYFDMPSKDAYKAASKIIRLKGDTPKTGLTYRIFDCMTAKEFKAQSCAKTYKERRAVLDTLTGLMEHVEVLPVLYCGIDESKITELLEEAVANSGEGVMLNLTQAPYVWNRSWNIMKCKKFNSLDLEVVGLEEGSGRLTNTLGAIQVRYRGGNIVSVGSGFSDDERKLYWEHPELIMNKIVEIKMFEETQAADGSYSLRFPTWVSNIRDPKDKANPDF